MMQYDNYDTDKTLKQLEDQSIPDLSKMSEHWEKMKLTLTPAIQPGKNGNIFRRPGFYAPPAARAGYPHITVPMGALNELPVGLSFIAGAFKEGPLLGIAYAYEQAAKKRVAPKFLKSI